MAQLFISHASIDVRAATALVEALEKRGFSCWIAPRDIPDGADWAECIMRGINGCEMVVVVVSERTAASVYVGNELSIAVEKRKRLCCVRIDDAPLADRLALRIGDRQHIDGRAYERDIDRVAMAVIGVLLPPPAPAAPKVEAPKQAQPEPRPGGGANPGGPAGEPRAAPPPSGSPAVPSLREVAPILERVRQAGVTLDPSLVADLERHLKGPFPQGDPDRGLAWLAVTEMLITRLHAALTDAFGAQSAALASAELSVHQASMVFEPKSRLAAEITQILGVRFNTERDRWTGRINENFMALRDKQERQAARVEHQPSTLDDGTVALRPTSTWWTAYTTWLRGSMTEWRAFIPSLLHDRWQAFVAQEAANAARVSGGELTITLPSPQGATLDDPLGGTELKAPEDVFDPSSLPVRSNQIAAQVARLSSLAGAGLSLYLQQGAARFAVGGILVVVGFGVGHMVHKRDVEKATRARSAKGSEALKKLLVEDFRRRLDRHRFEVDRFVTVYTASVRQTLTDQLNAFAEQENRRRSELFEQKRPEFARQQLELRNRIDIIHGSIRTLASPVLVDISLRRSALNEEAERARRS